MIGTPRLHLRAVDSTNLRARSLALAGAPHGTLVTATEQTAGRGRQGRTWTAPPGSGLLMSLVLRDPPALLPLAAALAVADTVGERATIKWPNDVLLADDGPRVVPQGEGQLVAAGRKVAGILAEGRPSEGWAVLGIGLNVAVRDEDLPEDLRATATTMGLEPGDVERVLGELLGHLDRRLGASAGETVAAWRERDALMGREIAWNGGAGVADGIDDGGRLRVRTDGGVVTLDAGEVHLTASA